jgi:uncharacterized damage-inducible protein DinB
MFTIDGIRKFHTWTHACIGVVLDHLSTIPEPDLDKEIPNFGFNTVRKQTTHILNCEEFWIHTLQGLPFTDRDPAESPTVADVRRLQAETMQRTTTYLSTLTDEQLNSNTELHFPDGDVAVRTPALVLHHLLTHAFHHKGQIVAMCRALGHPAPDTDLNHFE